MINGSKSMLLTVHTGIILCLLACPGQSALTTSSRMPSILVQADVVLKIQIYLFVVYQLIHCKVLKKNC